MGEYIVPAFLTQVIYFLAMSLTSESFISERAQGLLERSWLVGVLPLEILTSYILSQFLVIVMQVAIALVVVFGVFQIPCSGSLPLFILLSLLQGECAKCRLLNSTISKQYWELMDGLFFDELLTY